MSRDTTVTYAGLTLMAACQTGKEMHFTRVLLGDGKISAEQNVRQMTGLVNPKMTLPVVKSEVTGVGTCIFETRLKNESLTQGFFAREVGIFAVDSSGNEILYAYRNVGDDGEYVPAGGGAEEWNFIYGVTTVIDQATNITINLSGDIAYVNTIDFEDHVNAASHPYFGPAATTGDTLLTADASGNKLHRISLDNTRTLILGDSASTIPVLRSRVNQLEIEQDNMMLKMVADDECPDSNLRLAEDFKNPDKVDTFSVQVVNATAGDATIGVASLSGVIPGAWYRITDGVQDEAFQVKSVAKNGSTFRITAAGNLVNTYDLNNCRIWRTTAQIDQSSGTVYGSGDQLGFVTKFDGGVWSGVTASTAITSALDTSQSAADNFTADSGVIYTDDGLISMNPAAITSVALSGSTWTQIDGEGE